MLAFAPDRTAEATPAHIVATVMMRVWRILVMSLFGVSKNQRGTHDQFCASRGSASSKVTR